MMINDRDDEHFASLCAGCASKEKFNQGTKAGKQKIKNLQAVLFLRHPKERPAQCFFLIFFRRR
jgi:hypothetical protein